MENGKKVITRRDFIRVGSCLTMGGLMGLPLIGSVSAKKSEKSRVVLIRDKKVIDSRGHLKESALQNMLDTAVTALMDTPDPVSAWKQLVKPADVVGIKTNVWHYLPTPEHLETAIWNRLLDAGVKKENISTTDRGVLDDSVFKRSTALINVRPMRTHHWSGLGTLLKNYIMFVRQPWMYHGNSCEKLGAIWQLPHVVGKTRLNILVMLTPLFHGTGPHHFSSRHVWPYSGLIVSRDPVAADATGARIIQAKRNLFFGAEKPISPPALHIGAADTRFGLGNSRADQIQLVRLGWEEDILI
jgi:hypothetical protein